MYQKAAGGCGVVTSIVRARHRFSQPDTDKNRIPQDAAYLSLHLTFASVNLPIPIQISPRGSQAGGADRLIGTSGAMLYPASPSLNTFEHQQSACHHWKHVFETPTSPSTIASKGATAHSGTFQGDSKPSQGSTTTSSGLALHPSSRRPCAKREGRLHREREGKGGKSALILQHLDVPKSLTDTT